MSISMFRSKVQNIEENIAELEKNIGKEREKIRKANDRIQRTKNVTTLKNAQKNAAEAQKKIGTLTKKKAEKTKSLNSALTSLENLQARETKKINTSELKHSKDLTNELKKQQRISKEISGNPIQINYEKLPEKINVLFLAANPSDQTQLRLDHELRSIREKLRASKHRDSINLEARLAVRPMDLMHEINEVEPHIIHFSGHGSEENEIILENKEGETSVLSKETVTQLMKTMSSSIKLVIFNSCFSSGQAEAVIEHIECAIGMNETISDDAAQEFAAQFYSAIGFGKSVEDAFEQGKLALDLAGIPESDTPDIYTRKGIYPKDLIMVKP